jgi:D-inositol-3-phosphate glycosyltransferase
MPRKIIIIGPAFPLRGGIANFNEALCRALNKKNNHTKIISFSLQYPSFLFPGKTQFDTGEGPKDLSIETKINSINPFNWLKVGRYIRNEGPDYVIIRYWLPVMAPCLGSIARIVKQNKKIKIIAITDNIIPHEKRAGDKNLTQYFISACDAFITLSQQVLNELRAFNNSKPAVFMPHPVYDIFGEKIPKAEALENLKLSPSNKHILFFGFIRNYKGLDLLLEAMADERIKQLGIKLIIAGEYYEDALRYENIIAKYNLSANIVAHTHFIDSNEVKNYFCASDMIVQPYRTATQSGVTQIAYHFERPMLVTDVGGLPEIVNDGKTGYVTKTNPQSIADALFKFYMENKEQEFSINCREEKKRFSWEYFVEGIEALIKKI